MSVYYNEFDKKKCAALKELMADGLISTGDIDDRPIQEVQAHELKGYTRCHFFAGIGLWDYALDLAGWGDKPVWTGSCPCQPFSSAGRQKGKADDRHLWPHWECLISECLPPVVFGEQVESAIAHGWLDDVYQGLEAQSYAVGTAILPACSVGAPHRRNRLWFVAQSAIDDDRRNAGEFQGADEQQTSKRQEKWPAEFSSASFMGNAEHDGSSSSEVGGSGQAAILNNTQEQDGTREFERAGSSGELPSGTLGNASSPRSQGHGQSGKQSIQQRREGTERHPWQTGVWIDCPDGKKRLVEPTICLLADGYPNRVLQLHCAGDGIVPQVAAEFIIATM